MRFPQGSEFQVDPPLRESLLHWKRLVTQGPPRPIDKVGSKLVDAVIFTDGFTPDPRSFEKACLIVWAQFCLIGAFNVLASSRLSYRSQ